MKRKRSWPNFRYYTGIYLEELRKTTKVSVRLVSVPVGILTEQLPNSSQKRYR
jgi:hypothetical protein